MNDSGKNLPGDVGAFGRLLRFWRSAVAYSQEELAARTGVSARHISFLENGRSRPGRAMVSDLARVLGLPSVDCNTLYAAAGFMPDPLTVNLDADHLRWLRKSLQVTLRSVEPTAASAIDRYGNVHLVNGGWLAMHRRLLPESRLRPPLNVYRLAFAEDGLRPLLVDWEDVACRLLLTLQQEALLSGDPAAQALLDELLSYPAPANWQRRAGEIEHQHSFRIRLHLEDDRIASFLNIVYTAGDTPFVSEPRVLISLMTPDNDAARELCEEDAGAAAHPLLPE